jgi:hypothetical protein
MQPTRAAALAISICVEAGGVAHAPLALLASYAQRALAATPTHAIRFCLTALAALPPPLQPTLGMHVFLEAAKAEPDALRKLLNAASLPAERQALHRLGYTGGVVEFARDFLDFRALPPPPLQPAAHEDSRVKAGTSAALLPAPPVMDDSPAETVLDEAASRDDAPLATADTNDSEAPIVDASMQPVSADARDADAAERGGTSCAEMCERIAARFGRGLELQLDGHGKGALERLRAVTMRSIHRLAAELYGGNVVSGCEDARTRGHGPGATTPRSLPSHAFCIFNVMPGRLQC